MSSSMLTAPAIDRPASDARRFDRRLYMTAAAAFALIVFWGFHRTYYLKPLFDTAPLPSRLVHLHGLLMTAWVVLFVVQVRLVSTLKIRVHQRLGYAAIGLAAAILAVGLVTAVRAAKYGSTSTPPGMAPLAFLIVPIFDLIVFALLFGAAILYRRRPAVHKPLMLLTAVNFLPPALGRIQIAPLQALGPLWFFGFPTAVALTCLGLDAWRRGAVNRVFLAGTLLLIASYVVRLAVMTTRPWLAVAAWLTAFV
jgi:hypothetical protein